MAARRNQAAYAFKGAVLGALRDVNDALAAIQRDREQDQRLDSQVDLESKALKISSERYKAGYTPYVDQLDSERQLLARAAQLHASSNGEAHSGCRTL